MCEISEKDWKIELTSMLEELDNSQYEKLMELLDRIHRAKRTEMHRERMPGVILQTYGLECSIRVFDDAMKQIPRMDAAIQERLRPFVNQLKEQEEMKSRGEKRKNDVVEQDGEEPAAGLSKENIKPLENREQVVTGAATKPRPWEISISDLKANDELPEKKAFRGNVIQKSGLRPYVTGDKKKFFFFIGVADQEASVRVKVYGKQRYKEMIEGKSYLFRRLLKKDDVVQVISTSIVSETECVQVPEKWKLEAQRLVYPLYSIAETKSFSEGTLVTLKGTIEEIDPIENVEVSNQKKKRQRFILKDDTGSIPIYMWGEETCQTKRLSVGDLVEFANIKIHQYFDSRSLNSCISTKVHKIKSVGVCSEIIEIIGIIKATKKETQLEAEFNQQVHTFVVGSKLLAKAFDLPLDNEFKESLPEKLPLRGEAEIQGNKIKKITAIL